VTKSLRAVLSATAGATVTGISMVGILSMRSDQPSALIRVLIILTYPGAYVAWLLQPRERHVLFGYVLVGVAVNVVFYSLVTWFLIAIGGKWLKRHRSHR
jgi:hypothetical protein